MSHMSYTIMYVLLDSVVSSLCFKCWEFKATYEPERFKLINQIYFLCYCYLDHRYNLYYRTHCTDCNSYTCMIVYYMLFNNAW